MTKTDCSHECMCLIHCPTTCSLHVQLSLQLNFWKRLREFLIKAHAGSIYSRFEKALNRTLFLWACTKTFRCTGASRSNLSIRPRCKTVIFFSEQEPCILFHQGNKVIITRGHTARYDRIANLVFFWAETLHLVAPGHHITRGRIAR